MQNGAMVQNPTFVIKACCSWCAYFNDFCYNFVNLLEIMEQLWLNLLHLAIKRLTQCGTTVYYTYQNTCFLFKSLLLKFMYVICWYEQFSLSNGMLIRNCFTSSYCIHTFDTIRITDIEQEEVKSAATEVRACNKQYRKKLICLTFAMRCGVAATQSK